MQDKCDDHYFSLKFQPNLQPFSYSSTHMKSVAGNYLWPSIIKVDFSYYFLVHWIRPQCRNARQRKKTVIYFHLYYFSLEVGISLLGNVLFKWLNPQLLSNQSISGATKSRLVRRYLLRCSLLFQREQQTNKTTQQQRFIADKASDTTLWSLSLLEWELVVLGSLAR